MKRSREELIPEDLLGVLDADLIDSIKNYNLYKFRKIINDKSINLHLRTYEPTQNMHDRKQLGLSLVQFMLHQFDSIMHDENYNRRYDEEIQFMISIGSLMFQDIISKHQDIINLSEIKNYHRTPIPVKYILFCNGYRIDVKTEDGLFLLNDVGDFASSSEDVLALIDMMIDQKVNILEKDKSGTSLKDLIMNPEFYIDEKDRGEDDAKYAQKVDQLIALQDVFKGHIIEGLSGTLDRPLVQGREITHELPYDVKEKIARIAYEGGNRKNHNNRNSRKKRKSTKKKIIKRSRKHNPS